MDTKQHCPTNVTLLASSRLRPPKRDIKPRRKDETLARYEADIRETGITTPLDVLDLDDGFYEILDGYTRFLAGERIHVAEYPCLIHAGPMDEGDKLLFRIRSEQFRTGQNPQDMAVNLYTLKEIKGWTQKRIADAIRRSESYVSKLLGVFERVPEDIRTLFGPNKGRAIYALSRLGNDLARLREVAELAAEQGWKCEQVEREVRKHLGTQPKRSRPKTVKITVPAGMVQRVLPNGSIFLFPGDIDGDLAVEDLKAANALVRRGKKLTEDEDKLPIMLPTS